MGVINKLVIFGLFCNFRYFIYTFIYVFLYISIALAIGYTTSKKRSL